MQTGAVEALIEACSQVAVEAAVEEEAFVLRVRPPGGDPADLQVQGRAVVSGDVAVADEGPFVVVADVVTGSARESLREQGVSWLDRRGHLRLVVGGKVLVDADRVPSASTEIGCRRQDQVAPTRASS